MKLQESNENIQYFLKIVGILYFFIAYLPIHRYVYQILISIAYYNTRSTSALLAVTQTFLILSALLFLSSAAYASGYIFDLVYDTLSKESKEDLRSIAMIVGFAIGSAYIINNFADFTLSN